MLRAPISIPAEVTITLLMITLSATLAMFFGLPMVYPTGDKAAYVGIHYLYPLVGLGVWGVFATIGQRGALRRTFIIALPCYGLVLFAHFNLKLWIPHINPLLFDDIYWQIDQYLRPIVDLCFWLREALVPVIPYEANLYMIGFIALFYISFCYHAVATPTKFRELFLSALLLQVIGTFAYIAAPAIGPFIYEQGLDPQVTGAQHQMLSYYQNSVAFGPSWLEENGGYGFTAGLAAMPSLHSAGAFLFFMFAFKHGKILIPLYSFILFFILITAVATRWHYLIDVPFGILVAWASSKAAEMLTRSDVKTEQKFPGAVLNPA